MKMLQDRSELSPMQGIALKIATRWVIDTKVHMEKQQECDDDDNEQPQSNKVGDRDRTDWEEGKTGRTTGRGRGWTGSFPRRGMPRGEKRDR